MNYSQVNTFLNIALPKLKKRCGVWQVRIFEGVLGFLI